MKNFSLCLLCLLASLVVFAQESDQSTQRKSTQQIGFTVSRLSGEPGVFGINNISHPGLAASLNWGLNTFTGEKRRGKIGFNVQLDYATAQADFERLEGGLILSRISDTLRDVRGGHLEYSSFSLLVPVYYRYYFGKKLFASINLGIRLTLADDVTFAYREFDYVLSTDEVLNRTEERVEEVSQRFTNSTGSIGLGWSFDKAEIELRIGGRGINFDHFYLYPESRTEISVTGMYRL